MASAVALMAILAVGGSTPALAQTATLPTKPIDLNLNNAPVKQALNVLFQGAGLNYTMDPSVAGYVTVNLRGVSFETALKAVLKSTYPPLVAVKDPDTGVYYIKVKTADTTTPGATPLPAAPVAGTGPGGAIAPSPLPYQAPSTSSYPSISMSQFETIQLKYADAGKLLAVLGQPSLVVPASSADFGGTGIGGAVGGYSSGSAGASSGASTTSTSNTSTAPH
ncbi:MAG: STN domain-containing protein [Capsulimonadaceae bacterium]|nr:STN domain-containing protein [Capsulimonadaceae bacterium]